MLKNPLPPFLPSFLQSTATDTHVLTVPNLRGERNFKRNRRGYGRTAFLAFVYLLPIEDNRIIIDTYLWIQYVRGERNFKRNRRGHGRTAFFAFLFYYQFKDNRIVIDTYL